MADNETTDIDAFAADIRAVDGNHDLGAAELAEKLIELGYTKGKSALPKAQNVTLEAQGDDWYATVNFDNGTIQSSPLDDASKDLIAKQKVENPHPPLSSYKQGDKVEVFKNGDFLPGFIQSIDKVSKHIHAHTDRGPVTIASPTSIRRPQA